MNWFSKEFYIFGRFSRKNRGFDPQISREVHNSGHRKNQKRKFRGCKNRENKKLGNGLKLLLLDGKLKGT